MISTDHPSTSAATPLTMRRITQLWWPLAAGWFLMTVEIPFLSAVIARHPDPQISLASWGLVFSIALILASPAMMLLSASTALSRDWPNFRKVERYMWVITSVLTALHALLAFTPLFDFLVVGILAAPTEIIEPARLGLVIMLPYVGGLAYRRFNYGVLIRFGHTRSVTLGALVRLLTDAVVVGILYLLDVQNGVIIATVTFTSGIVGEAIYSGLRLRPILNELRAAPLTGNIVNLNTFAKFYLALDDLGAADGNRCAQPHGQAAGIAGCLARDLQFDHFVEQRGYSLH
jgi:Na+-driven multidrug efflux pump